LIDKIGTPAVTAQPNGPDVNVDSSAAGGKAMTPWGSARLIKGWAPWYGFGWRTVMEGGVSLMVDNIEIDRCGPHKEAFPVMYDSCGPIRHIPGDGYLVQPGQKVYLQMLLRNTSGLSTTPAPATMQSNANIFSVAL